MRSLKLYDSVADLLSSWRLVTRQRGMFAFPVHMMIFDSSDGAYHAYLSQQRRPKSFSPFQRNQVSDHLSKLSTQLCKKAKNWVFHNVSDINPGRELALQILQCCLKGKPCPTFLSAPDEIVMSALSVILSGLPSDITWDVCGIYDHNITTGHDLPATICWADNGVTTGVIWEKWYASVGNQHGEDSVELLPTLLPSSNKECRLPNARGEWMVRGNDYIAYSRLYDLLRTLLFESNWQCMLYDAIDIGHSFFGIIFYDVLNSVASGYDLSIRTLNDLMPDFTEAKHRDFAVYIEKMLLHEWDEAITTGFPALGEPSDNRDCLLRLARHVNRAIRTDLCCLRLTSSGGSGDFSEGHFWRWARRNGENEWLYEISWPESISKPLELLQERQKWGEIVHVQEEVAGLLVEMWLKPKGGFPNRDGGRDVMTARVQQLLRHRLQVISDYFSTLLKRHDKVERICNAFLQLVGTSPKESRVQRFLEENPSLLSFDGKIFWGLLLSQLELPFPKKLKTDFAFLAFDGSAFTLWLVEIERPRPPSSRNKKKMKEDPSLTKGCEQVRKWLTFLDNEARRIQYLKELRDKFLEAAGKMGLVDAVERTMLEQRIRKINFMLIAGDETYLTDVLSQPERKGERFGSVSDISLVRWETYPRFITLMRSVLKVSWMARSDTRCYNVKTGKFMEKRLSR